MRRKVSAAKALGPLAAAVLVSGLAACGGVVKQEPNLIAGKEAFVAKCGACHALNRAGTKGITGPNLDEAFTRSLQDGMKRSTIEGVVLRQIGQPNRRPQVDPQTKKPLAAMPANLVKGGLARDVAAYVAATSARSGQDTGRLADVGQKKATATATEKNGVLDIPVASGGLAFDVGAASANAGKVEIESKNPQPIGHNIAVQGNGVDSKGPVVSGGQVSKVTVDLKPGTYTFYCSVPGHREGGMVGKITVK